ncbi:hypothetical protein PMAYCL1PPCAC_07068, partial [Pristionchus mayeri]
LLSTPSIPLSLSQYGTSMSSIHRLINESEKVNPLLYSFMAQSDGGRNLFPPTLFNQPNFTHNFYASLQQQLMLQQLHNLVNPNGSTRDGSSPSHSDADIESSMNESGRNMKRVKVEEDGSAQCPMCEERLHDEKEWRDHVDMERRLLKNTLSSIKKTPVSVNSPSKEVRSAELTRIKSNLQRRKCLKVESGKKSPSSLNFLSTPSSDSPLTCCSCRRSIEYGIVCSTLEGARCQGCFDEERLLRKSTPPVSSEESTKMDCPPCEKRIKLEE